MIRGIKFAGIPVKDQDAALKFYTEKLGMKVQTDQPFTAEGHEDRIGTFQSLSFWCEDVFQTAKVMKAKGVEFSKEPVKEVWGSVAIFKDADGNQFVLSSK
jgi:catechol 2,3-dioxygenase-like lactoylglutathione lyase family enzyme